MGVLNEPTLKKHKVNVNIEIQIDDVDFDVIVPILDRFKKELPPHNWTERLTPIKIEKKDKWSA